MPGIVEQTAVKAVFTPDKLKFGRAAPPLETWAESVIRSKKLNDYETLKKLLSEGKPLLDTTESDIKGMEGKINSIGKDIDTATGEITRVTGSTEEKQYNDAKNGIKDSETLLKYESLLPTDRDIFADKVVAALQERQDVKDSFNGLNTQQKRELANAFIRNHKKDILDILRGNVHTINTESRFDSNAATSEMYASEEAHAKTQLEHEAVKDAVINADTRVKELIKDKNEFDTPAPGNKGQEMKDLGQLAEQIRLATMVPMGQKINEYQEMIANKQELFNRFKKDPKAAAKAGINLKDLSDEIFKLQSLRLDETNKYLPLQVQQQRLEALRKEKVELPQDIQKAQNELDAKKIEEKAKESALKKAADHMRVAREHKVVVDEDLTSVTRDLWKDVINDCVTKELETMLASLTSPEGRSAMMAGALTMLDRKMEDMWSTTHKRLRWSTVWGGKFPQQRFPSWEDVPVADREKINSSFNALMKDKEGTGTENIVKGLLGKTWEGLTRDEQQQTTAAYVTKLIHRKVVNLKTNLRDGEIRALRSGPFANELIKIGLIRNPGFRQQAANIPGVNAANLDNPTPENIQHIKGGLDKSNLLSLLMLGLTPLSMMKQQEERS